MASLLPHNDDAPDRAGAPARAQVQPIDAPTTYHGQGNYDYPSNYAAENNVQMLSSANALWLLLGVVSAHRIYFGALLSATIQAVLLWLGVAMILQDADHVGAGRALVLIFAVWWVMDGFRIPEMVRNRAVDEGVAFG